MRSHISRNRSTSLSSTEAKQSHVARAVAATVQAFEALEDRTLFCSPTPVCTPAPVCPGPVCPAPVCPAPVAPVPVCGNPGAGLISGASVASDFTNSLDLYGVLGIGGTNICITGPNTHIGGDVAVGQCSTGSFSNTQIDGNLDIDTTAKVTRSCNVNILGSTVKQSLSTADADVVDASLRVAAIKPTQTLGNITCTTTINQTANVNIVNVKSIQLCGKSTLTLCGTSTSYFMINVSGAFTMADAAAIKLTGGLVEAHVLFNVVGCGSAVCFSGCAIEQGEIVAVDRDVTVNAATVDGAILGAMCHTICISNGAQIQVNAPHFQPPIGY